MNKKININPSSTKWLEKDDRVVADYFCDLGFRSLKQILDMRVFDLMNMQGLNAVRVEEVIICLYKWLNPNTAIDEAIYNGMMSQPFLYTPWRKEHKDLAAIKVGDLVLTPGINMKAIQHFYDAIRKAFFKSEEYNWRWAVTLIGGLFITVMSFILIMTVYGRFFKLYMYTALAPIPLSTFAGEPSQNVGKSFIKSYCAVCLEGAVIVLSCIIFSLFASSPPVVNPDAAAVTQVWSYVGELLFNMLVLVGAVKMSARIIREMMGL